MNQIKNLFKETIDGALDTNYRFIDMLPSEHPASQQQQTREVFSKKWNELDFDDDAFKKALNRQKQWYLALYGFSSEADLKKHLEKCSVVIDAGAGK